jgi:hypothetical protein
MIVESNYLRNWSEAKYHYHMKRYGTVQYQNEI